MAIQYQYHLIGSTKTYHSTKPIARKPLMAVWVHLLDPLIDPSLSWVQIPHTEYDLINQNAVIHKAFELDPLVFDLLELRVADTEDELTQVPSDFGIVADIADEIVIVAGIADEVAVVATEPLRSAIELVGTDPLKQAILDVTTDPLKQAILDAEVNAQRAEDAADASEASAVRSGQEADRAENAADDAEQRGQLEVWEAEAEALTANSYADEFIDGGGTSAEWVKQYVSNGDGTFTATGIANTFSSYYWATKSNLGSSGLNFQDVWDASTGIYPTTRPNGDPLEVGDYFIVNVNGQTPDLIDWFIGDFVIVTGVSPTAWGRYPNTVDWNAVQNIPANVSNAVNRGGDTMTGALKGITPVAIEDLTRKDYVDGANATQDATIALNTAKVSYKDSMTFDGTTLAITIG